MLASAAAGGAARRRRPWTAAAAAAARSLSGWRPPAAAQACVRTAGVGQTASRCLRCINILYLHTTCVPWLLGSGSLSCCSRRCTASSTQRTWTTTTAARRRRAARGAAAGGSIASAVPCVRACSLALNLYRWPFQHSTDAVYILKIYSILGFDRFPTGIEYKSTYAMYQRPRIESEIKS
jgi:hypothetical protein